MSSFNLPLIKTTVCLKIILVLMLLSTRSFTWAQGCINIDDPMLASSLAMVEMKRRIPYQFEQLTASRAVGIKALAVTLTFKVGKTKEPEDILVKGSSGDQAIDNLAVQAVQSAAPYRGVGNCYAITLHYAPSALKVVRDAAAEEYYNWPKTGQTLQIKKTRSTIPGNPIAPSSSRHPSAVRSGPIVRTPGPSMTAGTPAKASSSITFTQWKLETQCQIQNTWSPPDNTQILAQLGILANGRLNNVKILQSSGDKLLDEVAIKKITPAAPFSPPPGNKPVQLPFQYTRTIASQCKAFQNKTLPHQNISTSNELGEFGPYIAELQRRIRRNWAPPVEDRNKRAVALFKVSRDGRLLSLRIQQSSGSPEADRAALAAVRASAPFKQLPPNYRGNDIDVQFIFDYETYGHGAAKLR